MKYPKGVKTEKQALPKKSITYGNRGMSLEHDLNITNEYYRNQNLAYIYKKPTPVKIAKVDYKTMKITEAFFESPSTTDYNGIYRGNYIDFEAKETNNKNSFPLKNIHKHQLTHMKHIYEHDGVCFLIVRFTKRNETYLLFVEKLFSYLENNSSSSIPYSFFESNGHLLEENYHPRIDYLKILKQYGGA